MKKTKCENCSESSHEHDEIIIKEDNTSKDSNKQSNSDEKSDIKLDLMAEKDKQIADLSEKFMRLAAEYDNFRRRSQKEKDLLYTESIATVAVSWLPVVDNLERALAVSAEYKTPEAQKIISGIEMILQQVKDAMNSLGIKEIDALNNEFDPNAMEAIMHIEDEDIGDSVVVEVFEKGYRRGDKILRHSMVKVAN